MVGDWGGGRRPIHIFLWSVVYLRPFTSAKLEPVGPQNPWFFISTFWGSITTFFPWSSNSSISVSPHRCGSPWVLKILTLNSFLVLTTSLWGFSEVWLLVLPKLWKSFDFRDIIGSGLVSVVWSYLSLRMCSSPWRWESSRAWMTFIIYKSSKSF